MSLTQEDLQQINNLLTAQTQGIIEEKLREEFEERIENLKVNLSQLNIGS